MSNTKSEDTLIFLATSPKTTNFNQLTRELITFFNDKQAIDPTDRFNLISFIENGPIYFEDFSFNGKYLIDGFKPYFPNIKRINTIGGIFVAITFIIDIFKMIAGKAFRLIILMDRNTPRLKNIEVLNNLVEKVVEFPFYIDIIRINVTNDPGEDAKLMKFVQNTGGKIYFAKNEKETGKILKKLSKKKQIKSGSFGEQKTVHISSANKPFFEHMAQDPVQYFGENSSDRCQICGEGKNLYKCPKCGVLSHQKCLAQWAKFSNIGLPHVFRCQSCFNLIKLDEDYVDAIQNGRNIEKKESDLFSDDWFNNQDSLLRENDGNQELIFGQDPMPMIDEESPEEVDEVFNLQKDVENIEIIFCPECGKLTTTEYKLCPDCGAKLS